MKDLVYWLQILFSAGIATLGLVLNSSAVIIGAMLISPLMAPILSQGLALSTGDLTLGVRSFANLFLSTILGVVFPLILVALLPFKNMTPEILARTEPNTLDLVIALFSGAIGSIATCRAVKGIVMSIPGVAIAVALMPPLCVVGYGLAFALTVDASKGWETAKGGGLLYLTNLVAITFTAMLVFVLLRIDTTKVRDAVREWREGDPESRWWLSQIDRFPALGKARKVRSFSLRLLMFIPAFIARLIESVGAEVVVGGALFLDHIEVDAYLEELNRRHQPDRLGAGAFRHVGYGLFQVAIGRYGNRKPEVEVAVSLVIVTYAGVLVNDLRAGIEGVTGDSHGDQSRLVPQAPRVEYGADLPDDVLVLEAADSTDDIILG